MKYRQWKVAPPCPEGQWELEEAGLPPLLAALLSSRGGHFDQMEPNLSSGHSTKTTLPST